MNCKIWLNLKLSDEHEQLVNNDDQEETRLMSSTETIGCLELHGDGGGFGGCEEAAGWIDDIASRRCGAKTPSDTLRRHVAAIKFWHNQEHSIFTLHNLQHTFERRSTVEIEGQLRGLDAHKIESGERRPRRLFGLLFDAWWTFVGEKWRYIVFYTIMI